MKMSFLVKCCVCLLLTGMLWPALTYGQKEYNVWYFGYRAGLDFNTSPPSPANDNQLYSPESTSSICDKNGNLLFYTNGDSIYNNQHQLMLNWNTPYNYNLVASAVQGSMILPMPGNPYLYYVITGLSFENTYRPNLQKDSLIRYSVVDIRGDGGLGEVVQKNLPLLKAKMESFAVTQHANQSDFWVAATDANSGLIKCIRTTNGQFTTPVINQTVANKSSEAYGNNKFSPDSRIYFGKASVKRINNTDVYCANLFKFNNATGLMSDPISFPLSATSAASGAYYCEFSPNSRFLYVPFFTNTSYGLFQYDLSVWDEATITASRQTVVFFNQYSLAELISGLQLAPDGKIYCFHNKMNVQFPNKLSVINNPDVKGSACGYSPLSVDLGIGNNVYGGPYYPSYKFKNKNINKRKDIVICTGDSVRIYGDMSANAVNNWNTGSHLPAITVNKEGYYIVEIINAKGYYSVDTFVVKISPKFKVYLGSDTAFCHQFSHLLKADSGYAKYAWSNGSVNRQITVTQKGMYAVKVSDSFNCSNGDTINIDEIKPPKINLFYDSVNCLYVQLKVDTIGGLSYLWSNGASTDNIKVAGKGRYSVKASNKFCSNESFIDVNELAYPEVYLGADTLLCSNEMILESHASGNHLWSNMSTMPRITVYSSGKYWVSVSRHNCVSSDTIELFSCDELGYYIPNVFSPNGDNTNEVFKVYGNNIYQVELTIFNRWGEILLETTKDKAPYWDGRYQGDVCPQGVYFYKVKIYGIRPGNIVYLKGSITLLH